VGAAAHGENSGLSVQRQIFPKLLAARLYIPAMTDAVLWQQVSVLAHAQMP
jgi:hypothetical protein